MSEAADRAYRAAVEEIARVKAAGWTQLRLTVGDFRALESLPDQIEGWARLQSLRLDGTQISDTGLAQLEGLTGLQSLWLNGTQVLNAGLRHIAKLTALQSLDLSDTQITDAGLEHLVGLKRLQSLNIGRTHITDKGLAHIAGLTGLQNLYLNDTQITDAGLTQLAGLKRLQTLNLSGTEVQDLRPIRDLPFIKGISFDLIFSGTPAVARDAKLAELVVITHKEYRTRQTLAYLKTLPPYPQDYLGGGQAALEPAPLQKDIGRAEPPLTRGQVKVKTSAAQIKVLLTQPRMTQITAKEVAVSLRAAMAGVQRENNALPEPLLSIAAIADALDNIGNIRIAPKQQDMVDDLKLKIAALEMQVEKLTAELADSDKAREAAEAIVRAQSFGGTLPSEAAKETVHVVGFLARAGGIGGIVYVLGATNPVVVAAMAALGALAK